MKTSIFSRLMFYLLLFFTAVLGISYFALTAYFESYYTQKRLDDLERRTHEVVIQYDKNGVDSELEALIEGYDEAGTVIQIIKTNDAVSKESVTIIRKTNILLREQSAENFLQAARNDESGRGDGFQKGQGDGFKNHDLGEGHQYGLSYEEQISNYQPGESFITLLETANQEVEWLTYKEVASDGVQVTGRIPLYSVNEVIDLVESFLLAFFFLMFACALIFAYFFAKGISKPIIELNAIAKDMGEFNFSKKYKGNRGDEIGQLGGTLNRISDELENALIDLKAELSKERTLEKMRQRFTATVSHEIQTPLSIIKSHAEALEDQIPESQRERMEYYQIIQEESDKVSEIASDLLNLAQMESGVYRLKKEAIDIQKFFKVLLKPYNKAYPELKINLESEGSGMIMIDPKRMEQVFKNIIGNAIKHGKNESIEIKSHVDKNYWTISIYNDGENIAAKELSQIWDYFYKGNSEKQGAGLGLAISRGIIKCHNGEINVKNEENGVTFLIEIPI